MNRLQLMEKACEGLSDGQLKYLKLDNLVRHFEHITQSMISDGQNALDRDLEDRYSWVYEEDTYLDNIKLAKRALTESGYSLEKIEQEIKENEDILESGLYDILYTVNEIMANELCAPCRVARDIIGIILSGDYEKAAKVAESALKRLEEEGEDLENFDVDEVLGKKNAISS